MACSLVRVNLCYIHKFTSIQIKIGIKSHTALKLGHTVPLLPSVKVLEITGGRARGKCSVRVGEGNGVSSEGSEVK